jgi:hypothetical protein
MSSRCHMKGYYDLFYSYHVRLGKGKISMPMHELCERCCVCCAKSRFSHVQTISVSVDLGEGGRNGSGMPVYGCDGPVMHTCCVVRFLPIYYNLLPCLPLARQQPGWDSLDPNCIMVYTLVLS